MDAWSLRYASRKIYRQTQRQTDIQTRLSQYFAPPIGDEEKLSDRLLYIIIQRLSKRNSLKRLKAASLKNAHNNHYVVQKRILGLDTALSCYSDVCNLFHYLLMAQCSILVMTLDYVLYSTVYFRFICFVMACVLSRHK